MIMDEAAEALAQAEFFEICNDQQRQMLAFAGDLRFFEADDVLYRAGDVPEGALVLVSGTLQARPEGVGKPSAIGKPGSVLSPMALVLPKPRPVTITAVSEGQVLLVPRHAFLKLVQQSPDLAQRAIARIQQDLSNYLGALQPLGKRMKGD